MNALLTIDKPDGFPVGAVCEAVANVEGSSHEAGDRLKILSEPERLAYIKNNRDERESFTLYGQLVFNYRLNSDRGPTGLQLRCQINRLRLVELP